MSAVLKRITTEYVPLEDRIRLCGETADGGVVVIWATRRLLARLLVPLMQHLEKQPRISSNPGMTHAFERDAARAAQTTQQPVRPERAAATWLAAAIDVSVTGTATRLTFRSADEQTARLALSAGNFHHWLSVLHDAWIGAGWPRDAWPAWMNAKDPFAAPNTTLH